MTLADIGKETAEEYLNDETDDTDDRVTVEGSGDVVVQLTDDDYKRASELALGRFDSYARGDTTDDNLTADKSGQELHDQGLLAEVALEIAYDSLYVDEEISASGDGRTDG